MRYKQNVVYHKDKSILYISFVFQSSASPRSYDTIARQEQSMLLLLVMKVTIFQIVQSATTIQTRIHERVG